MGNNSTWTLLAGLAGMLVGGFCVWMLRKRALLPQPLLWQLAAWGGGIFMGGLLLGSCVFFFSGGAAGAPPPTEPKPTVTPTPTRRRPTNTPILPPTQRRPTNTPIIPTPTQRLPTDTPTPTSTAGPTETATPAPLPSPFDITLVASNESVCGFGGFQAPYTVTIEGATMTLFQVNAGITSTGSYDPASGAFTTSVGGLPGTEIYSGTISFDGATITISGTYTYDDPQACDGLWAIFGQATP
jgi:hypothetical protein